MHAPEVVPHAEPKADMAAHQAIADQWLSDWEAACTSGKASALADCLTPDCHWRDLVAFHWSVHTWSGHEAVLAQLSTCLPSKTPSAWRRHANKPLTRWVERDGHTWLEVSIEFDTQLARGEGLVRLKRSPAGQWQAWTLMTTVQWFKGHKPKAMRKAAPTEHIRRFQGPNWADRRAEAMRYTDRQPEVLVVGAGQAGLSIAARLTQLGVDTLVVDKHQQLGDNWRTRYHALVLHNKATVNHLPFMPFPSIWPTYIPKDKLADWLETDPASPILRTRRAGEDIDALIDLRAVFQQTFEDLDFEHMPTLLKPHKGKLGLMDYEKVFCTDHKGLGDIFDMRGIDRDQGCMIVVRPDQYVAHVLPLDGTAELAAFFEGIFLPA